MIVVPHTHQLRDVPDAEGDLDEPPVAPDADVLAAVVVRIPQADQHLRMRLWDYSEGNKPQT